MCVAVSTSASAVVLFEASLEPDVVPVGRHAVLTVTLSGETSSLPDVRPPELAGADVSGGGSSQSYQMTGSAVSVTKTWTWLIAPRGAADVDIPPFEIVIDGATHRTRALKLRVDDTANPPVTGNGNRTAAPVPADRGTDRPAPDQPGPGDDRFVTLELDKTSAHVGEQLVLTFRYYENVGSRGFDRPEYSPSRTEGFWRENLGETEAYRERRGGVLYQVSRIRYSLVPTRPGDLIVEPARVVLPRDVFSNFFGNNRRGSAGVRELWTNSIKVEVADLPAPAPDDFSGLVSRGVALRAALDRDRVPRGEAVSVTIELVGDGSLKNVELPAWDLPDAFTVHEAGGEVDQRPVSGRLKGLSRQERIVQPREEGSWVLPPVELSYFDTVEDRYRSVRSEPLTLTVTPSDLPVTGDSGVGGRSRSLERLAEDLAFVKSPSKVAVARATPFVESGFWWLAVSAPLVLLVVWRLLLARHDAEMRDPAGRRRRLALPTALGLLAAARKTSVPADGTAAVQKAIMGYVADRLGLARAAVGRGDLLDLAAASDADGVARSLLSVLETCERARFGTGEISGDSESDLIAETETALRALAGAESGRRAVRAGAWLLPFVLCCGLTAAGGAQAAPDPARLTAEGVQAYTAGDLGTARALFTEAEQLTGDPVVSYDLGTTCARQGDLGAAVLHLERASRGRPRDADIAANMSNVRGRLADSVATGGTSAAVALMVGLAGRLTLDEWSLLVVVLAWIVAGGVAHAWWRGFFAPWHRRVLVGFVVSFLLAAAVLAGRWHDERRVVHAVVMAEEVSVRSGPESSFPVLFEAHAGLALHIEEERDGWSQVALGGEWRGWVPTESVAAVNREHERRRREPR